MQISYIERKRCREREIKGKVGGERNNTGREGQIL